MGIKARVRKMEKSLNWRDWLPDGVSVQEAERQQRELARRLADQVLADRAAGEAEE